MPSPHVGLKKYFRPMWGKTFNWVISSDLLPLNDYDIPTFLYRFSGSRSFPDISFSLFSLVLSCSWEVLQNLGSNYLQILLTVFRPNKRLPSLNFQKARWDDFAFYFDSRGPSAEEYSPYFLSFAAVLFTSLTLNVLTIWCSGQTACSFFFWQGRLRRTCQLLSLGHWGHSFLFGRPSMLKFFHWSLRHSTSSLLVSAAPTNLPFLISSPSILLSLCPRHSVLSSIFPFTLISGRNCFLSPPVLSGYNGSQDTRFSRETTRLMSWPDGERYLFPQQFLVVSLLSSLISTLLFSRTGGILSYLNSSTHRFPRFPPRNLCFYVKLAVFSLAFAATYTVFC